MGLAALRHNPQMYEVNTGLLMQDLSRRTGRGVTLASIPDGIWTRMAELGFDLVWMMGVWRRSPESRREALGIQGLRDEFDRALPGWTDADVVGSPYAIRGYELSGEFGTPDEPARLRSKLNDLGLRLVLDFVPNHLACDHPWVSSHPERFVVKDSPDGEDPSLFFRADTAGGRTLFFAHGRDPNFPPWTDTAQVNIFSASLREALAEELLRIAGMCDGVRCDMAMLALTPVFNGIWGRLAGNAPPGTEFWADVIGRVRQSHPGFLFIAEAYWGTEGRLRELGFDFTYDKTLYDRLRFSGAADVRAHLASRDGQGSVRFIENHDEQRAIEAFGRDRSFAAATVAATSPGMRLFHYGQLEGRRTKTPVQIARSADEQTDPVTLRFYERLLTECASAIFHEGRWELLDCGPTVPGDDSHMNVLAWSWQFGQEARLVAVNYSPSASKCRIKLPHTVNDERETGLSDALSGRTAEYTLIISTEHMLDVELEPWESRILDTGLLSHPHRHS